MIFTKSKYKTQPKSQSVIKQANKVTANTKPKLESNKNDEIKGVAKNEIKEKIKKLQKAKKKT